MQEDTDMTTNTILTADTLPDADSHLVKATTDGVRAVLKPLLGDTALREVACLTSSKNNGGRRGKRRPAPSNPWAVN